MFIYESRNGNIFLINFKCCFSTFRELHKNKIVKGIRALNQVKNIESKNIYIIVRNPYSKIKSFYKNKFVDPTVFPKVQKPVYLKTILQYIPMEKIENHNFTFSELISVIKKGFNDKHIKAQTLFFEKIKKQMINNKINKKINIVKMEDKNFSQIMSNLLDIDKFPHSNKSKSKTAINMTKEEKEFIYKKYKKDFIKFNYAK